MIRRKSWNNLIRVRKMKKEQISTLMACLLVIVWCNKKRNKWNRIAFLDNMDDLALKYRWVMEEKPQVSWKDWRHFHCVVSWSVVCGILWKKVYRRFDINIYRKVKTLITSNAVNNLVHEINGARVWTNGTNLSVKGLSLMKTSMGTSN